MGGSKTIEMNMGRWKHFAFFGSFALEKFTGSSYDQYKKYLQLHLGHDIYNLETRNNDSGTVLSVVVVN